MQEAVGSRDDVVVLAISPGKPAALRELRARLRLRVPLLSDPSWTTYRAYGFRRAKPWQVMLSPRLWQRYAKLVSSGRRPERPTEDVFELGGDALIDGDGRIAWISRAENVLDRPPAAEVLSRLAELQATQSA